MCVVLCCFPPDDITSFQSTMKIIFYLKNCIFMNGIFFAHLLKFFSFLIIYCFDKFVFVSCEYPIDNSCFFYLVVVLCKLFFYIFSLRE